MSTNDGKSGHWPDIIDPWKSTTCRMSAYQNNARQYSFADCVHHFIVIRHICTICNPPKRIAVPTQQNLAKRVYMPLCAEHVCIIVFVHYQKIDISIEFALCHWQTIYRKPPLFTSIITSFRFCVFVCAVWQILYYRIKPARQKLVYV